MKKIIFVIITFLGVGMGLFGQQDPHYSMYMFNGMAINPAYAGSRGQVSSLLLLREQWLGFDGRPRTQSFTIHGPTRNLRHGFGFSVVNDQMGPIQDLALNAAYAYRIPIGEEGALALGLQGSLANYRSTLTDLRTNGDPNQVPSPTDNAQANNNVNLWLPNIGTGIYFNTKRFFLGGSILNLIENELTENPTGDPVTQRYRHYVATTGLVIGNKVKLKPSVLLKYQQAAGAQADLNLSLLFKEKFWLGASFRTEDAWVFIAQWQIAAPLRIGYAYDLSTNSLRSQINGSHEFMLGFDFNFRKKDVVSPRYF